MRHQNSRLRLKQKPAHARMLERNLVTSLLLYEAIRTTKRRAKVIQPIVDKLISYAKSNPPHIAIRYVNRVVTDKNASRKIMEVYCKRYADRSSGLSRITPVGARRGDGAEIVDIVLIDAVICQPVEEKKAPNHKGSGQATKQDDSEKEKAPEVEKKESAKKKKS